MPFFGEVNGVINDVSQALPESHRVAFDKGREVDEKSAVLIKDGILRGYASVNLNSMPVRLYIPTSQSYTLLLG